MLYEDNYYKESGVEISSQVDRDIDVMDKEGEECDPEVEFLGRKAEIGRMYVENEKLVKRLDMHGPPDFKVFIQR